MARRLRAWDLVVVSLLSLGQGALLTGDDQLAHTYFEEALSVALTRGDGASKVQAASRALRVMEDDTREVARKVVDEAIADSKLPVRMRLTALLAKSWSLLEVADDEALEKAETAKELAIEVGDDRSLAEVLIQICAVTTLRGDAREGLKLATDAVAASRRTGDASIEVSALSL
jgi:hypothetical protein